MSSMRTSVAFGGKRRSALLLAAAIAVSWHMTASWANGEAVGVRVCIVKGSSWDTDPKGRQLIRQHVIESRRIWFAGARVKVSIKPAVQVIEGKLKYSGNRRSIPPDLAALAAKHGAAARNILCVFTDEVLFDRVSQRGYVHALLVQKDTPVVLISKQVLAKPGTKRTLAHELGHVLLRNPGHEDGRNNLMCWYGGANLGAQLTDPQKESARKYPMK